MIQKTVSETVFQVELSLKDMYELSLKRWGCIWLKIV